MIKDWAFWIMEMVGIDINTCIARHLILEKGCNIFIDELGSYCDWDGAELLE